MKCKGSVHVFTGNGKGKTTASLGLALQAVSKGKRVCVIQFMKGVQDGEFHASKRVPNLKIIKAGTKKFADPQNPSTIDVLLAHGALEVARETLARNEADVLILDEANMAAAFHLIPPASLADLIRAKPASTELILTGRSASKEVISLADSVVSMKSRKHAFNNGVQARKGTEY
ncbi:cob(I)yrinic acid a,c-diamide adenosyltransferase [Candidatus Micrarchaeota archaeon]|nr:cob(I)yrinic acid a,c-diamide adenosyltransferase [Candidatus Micrarchaeota archaeon]